MRRVLPLAVVLALLLLTVQVTPAAGLETELKGASAPATTPVPAVPATTEWGMLIMVLLVLTASTAFFRNRGLPGRELEAAPRFEPRAAIPEPVETPAAPEAPSAPARSARSAREKRPFARERGRDRHFKRSELAPRRAEFERRRDELLLALSELPGLSCVRPQGAFYLFPNVSGCFGGAVTSGEALARHLIERAGVAVVPGEAFGSAHHLRLSYAVPLERLREALARMAEALAALA